MLNKIAIFLIIIYQKTLSPDKWVFSPFLRWKVCIHTPHCSQYCKICYERYDFLTSSIMSMERISSCVPRNQTKYDPPFYKVVFFCSSPIWNEFFKKIFEQKKFEVVGVVTTADSPVGRWKNLAPNGFKKFVQENYNIPIFCPEKINPEKSQSWKKFFEQLKNLDADIFVVISYWKILPQNILDLPKIAPLNIHGSILPKYRWASPIQTTFLNEDKIAGLTLMKLDAWVDTGDIVDIQEYKLWINDTANDLIKAFEKNWPKWVNEKIIDFCKGDIEAKKQNLNKWIYCKKIEKSDWEIYIQDSLKDIFRKYKAYFLWPKIYFFDGKRIIIENILVDEKLFEENKSLPWQEDWVLNKAIKTLQVKPEWKKTMSREDFQRWKK